MSYSVGSRLDSDLDSITFSVILNRLNAIAAEMTLTLEYTAWTSILSQARDFSCAIYDASTRQVAMNDALPIHTNSLHLVLREIARTFEDDIADGDAILCNSPYRGNTHIGDVVVAVPVFFAERHMFWSLTKGHQQDIGAYLPTSVASQAVDIWQEGLQIPPVKIFSDGKPREDVIDFYLSNLRWRELLEGDLMAMVGSVWSGRRRLESLCGEYGNETLNRYLDAAIEYASYRTAEAIEAMPNGVYYGETWVDSDGYDNTHLPIRATVTIRDDSVEVDFAGSAPQARGGFNASLAVAQAAGALPVVMAIDPDIPHNQGCLEHVSVTAEEGTICLARYPGATACATFCPGDAMQEAVYRALAEAIPESVRAGGAKCQGLPTFSGVDAEGKSWGVMLFNGAAAGGAAKGADGWPLILSASGAGGYKVQPVEQVELLYPVMVEEMEIEPESMGYGEWIGGPGVRFSLRPLVAPLDLFTFGDGVLNPPFGVAAGTPGIGGGQYVETVSSGARRYAAGSGRMQVGLGEIWTNVSSGGGGYGSPRSRDADRVREDVRDGTITRETAREVFGVVVTDALDPEVDQKETASLREAMARIYDGAGEAATVPTEPGAATWITDALGAGDTFVLNPFELAADETER